jgi:hypothetical protein
MADFRLMQCVIDTYSGRSSLPRSPKQKDKELRIKMKTKMTMIYWKSDKFWLGKLLEHPEIMTQGESLEELEENIKDAYLLMALDDVPDRYETKEISL